MDDSTFLQQHSTHEIRDGIQNASAAVSEVAVSRADFAGLPNAGALGAKMPTNEAAVTAEERAEATSHIRLQRVTERIVRGMI